MRTEIKLFAAIWLVYAVYVTPAGGVTPNRYVDLVHAIVNEGRFAIDTYQENTIDKAYYEGHYYAGALPGPAFLAVPAYVVFKSVYGLIPQQVKDVAGGVQSFQKQEQAQGGFYGGVDNTEFFLSQTFLNIAVLAVVSALGSVFLYKTIRLLGYDEMIGLFGAFFYAFGTIVFFYSTLFFEQVFTATLAIGAFYFAAREIRRPRESRKPFWIFLAGLLAGSGLLVEYTAIFVIIWLGIWVLLSCEKQYWFAFGIALIIPLSILLAYDYALFANPFTTVYAHLIPEFDSVHGIGFFGATYPRLDRFLALMVGDERGLFLFVPVALGGVFGLIDQIWKRKANAPSALVIGLTFVTYVLFFSAYTNWRGGAAFGPRYLIGVLPLVIVGVAFAFERLPRPVIYGLGAISVFISS